MTFIATLLHTNPTLGTLLVAITAALVLYGALLFSVLNLLKADVTTDEDDDEQ